MAKKTKHVYFCSYGRNNTAYKGDTLFEAYQECTSNEDDGLEVTDCLFYKADEIDVVMKIEQVESISILPKG